MATVKRTYKLISKTEVETYPRVNGQVLGLYDADGLYYDVDINGNPDTTATQIVRRWVSGVKVVTELPDPAAAEIEDRPREGILYINIGGEEDRPDGTPLYTLHVWSGSDWFMVGSNYLDEDVKTIPSSEKFYLAGSPAADEPETGSLISTLLKNINGGFHEDGVYVTVNAAQQTVIHADIFDGAAGSAATAEYADHADIANKDNSDYHNDITSYYRGVTSSYEGSAGTLLTFHWGDGEHTTQVRVADTTYTVFSDTHDGLVPMPVATASSPLTDLILFGDHTWKDKDSITIGTADKAVNDINNVPLISYAQDVIGKDASGNPVQSPNPATKVTVTYGNGTSKDIEFQQYGRFSSASDGLAPAASNVGDDNRFLRGDCTWADAPIPSTGDATKYLAGDGTWKGAFTAATASTAGTVGIVPAPAAGDVNKILSNEGWVSDGARSTNDDSTKLYVVGATAQAARADTNSNENVFILNSRLYQKSDLSKTEDFTGDGETTSFDLTFPIDESQGATAPVITINGTAVPSTDWSIVDNILTFTTAPSDGDEIEITYSIEPANEVVDVSSAQNIYGKTYEGYTLKDACSYASTDDMYLDFEDTFTGAAGVTTFNLLNDASNISLITVAGQPVSAADYTFVQCEEFSAESTYAVGDYCIHEDADPNNDYTDIYRCITAVTTPGAWNSANWTVVITDNTSPDIVVFNTAPAAGSVIVVDYNQLDSGKIPTTDAVSTFVAESIATVLDISNNHVNNEVITDYYNETVSYNVGAYCMFQATGDDYAKIYRCKNATAGTPSVPVDFDPTDWDAVTLIDLIGHIFYATLTAGSTSLTISDPIITNDSTVEVFTNKFGATISGITTSTGSVTITFLSHPTDTNVKVKVS